LTTALPSEAVSLERVSGTAVVVWRRRNVRVTIGGSVGATLKGSSPWRFVAYIVPMAAVRAC